MDEFTEVVQENGFTQEQETEYINNDGAFCPFCNSDDLDKTHTESFDVGENWGVTCKACGKKWTEVQVLHIAEIFVDTD